MANFKGISGFKEKKNINVKLNVDKSVSSFRKEKIYTILDKLHIILGDYVIDDPKVNTLTAEIIPRFKTKLLS